MKLFAASALLALVATGATPAPAPSPSPRNTVVAAHGRLRVQGTYVVDQAGKPIALRGASLFWSQ